MIPRQPVFDLSSECSVLRVEATNVSFTIFGLTRSTALEASKLTITPPMWSFLERGIRQYILSTEYRTFLMILWDTSSSTYKRWASNDVVNVSRTSMPLQVWTILHAVCCLIPTNISFGKL
jgi:hypothetical protein